MSKKRWLATQNVIYSYNELLFSHKKRWITDTHYNMDVGNHGEKSNSKGLELCDSIYMNCLEQANPQR